MKVTIYSLHNPLTNELRYVGKTTAPLRKRLANHVHAARKYRHYTASWIKSLLEQGVRPVIREIEVVDLEFGSERERHWIAYYRASGARLTNLTDGGDGQAPGFRHSAEVRARCGNASRQAWLDPEYRQRVTSKLRGRERTAEHRQAISVAKRGSGHHKAKFTDDQVREIRELTGIIKQSEIAERFGVSPSTIRDIQKGRTWTHIK